MIKNISISSFINAIFTIAVVAILITFALFINLDMQKHQIMQKNRYEIIAENFLSVFNKKPSKSQLDKLYEQFKVKQVKSREEKLNILNYGYALSIKKLIWELNRIYLYILNILYVTQH